MWRRWRQRAKGVARNFWNVGRERGSRACGLLGFLVMLGGGEGGEEEDGDPRLGRRDLARKGRFIVRYACRKEFPQNFQRGRILRACLRGFDGGILWSNALTVGDSLCKLALIVVSNTCGQAFSRVPLYLTLDNYCTICPKKHRFENGVFSHAYISYETMTLCVSCSIS